MGLRREPPDVPWEPDWQLRGRMALAVLLVVALPVAFADALLWILNTVVPALTAALLDVRLGGGYEVSVTVLLVLVLAGVAAQYLFGDRLAMRSVGAKPVTADDYPDLHARVDRLARQADLPSPSVAVADAEMPNAFATGRSPASSTVVVTTGLLETLDDRELDGVLAHELAHVRNRDVPVMTVAYLLPTLTYLVAVASYVVLSAIWNVVGALRHSDGDDARPLVAVVVIFVVTSLLTLAVSTFFWVGSFRLSRLLSRYRERAADRGAAVLTGDPAGLASALRTIDGEMEALPDRDLREYDGGVEALYVSGLDAPMFTDDDRALLSRDIFPETHPPTEERVAALRELAADLERT